MSDFRIDRRTLIKSSAAALALSAFGARPLFAQDQRLRFIWWGSQERADRTNKAIAAYREINPGLTVDGEFVGWSDYWTRLATQVAGRNAPDLIQMDYRYIFEYARRGALMPLDEYVGNALQISDFGQNNIDAGKVDGKLYGINLGVNSSAALYDAAAWEAAGATPPSKAVTWDQFAENCAAFAKGNKKSNFYATADASGLEPSFELWLRQQGKALYNADGKVGYEPKDAAAWFAYWGEIRKAGGCVTPDIQALDTLTIETNPLTTGYAATGFAHSNQYVGYQALNKSKLVISSYPVREGGQPGHYYKPSMLLSLSAGTQAADAAVKLANFLVADATGVNILGVERGVPASDAMRAQLASSLDETSKAMVDYIADIEDVVGALPPPPPKGAGEIAFALTRISQEVAFEAKTAEEGGEQLVVEATSILERA
ncbi:ABC transporter substrate-binding protein [Chthonobacter rhizosphaerae]|uniref:ABC transporter substrate-binding protein n=1 Tax=Chthonobacter rhizosphaerae TaxID=2735553 RepID=UPI0015EF3C56|nr:extracellular solute-binding protein [Chthonobacter rhizosphaerae]